jgi:protein-tyrosine-phosphatase/DNA-binding transcriptional ArsR family regulator
MTTLLDRARMHAAMGDAHRLAIVDAVSISDKTPGELAALLDSPTNLVAHHLNVLESAGVIERRVSEGDRRRRYIVLHRQRLASLTPAPPATAASVLFVCTHNSARSQFAAALWRQRTGNDASSAGTAPAATVHPLAVKVARRMGVDIADRTPHAYADVRTTPDLVVSVCDRAGESPVPFSARRLHWSIADPVADGRIAAFDAAFADISDRIGYMTTTAGRS